MPFKKEQITTVTTGEDIASSQKAPLSQEGLNASNFKDSTYTPALVSSQEQAKRQHDVTLSAQQTNASTTQILNTSGKPGPAQYGLTKPRLEDIPKPPDQMTAFDDQIGQLVIDKIWNCIWYLEIAYFFTKQTKAEKTGKVASMTPQQRLQDKVNRATRHDYQICMELYKIPDIDTATDLAVLTLFDVVMLIDDSYSMRTTGVSDMSDVPGNTEDYDPTEGEVGNRISRWDLAILLAKVGAQVMTMFDDDGISLRFLNHTQGGDNISDHKKVADVFKRMTRPGGATPIGKAVGKIYREFLYDQLNTETLEKPVLVLTYTDGDSNDDVVSAVRMVRAHTKRTSYGSRSVLFSFCQVGNCVAATNMLKVLDKDPDSKPGANDGAGDITDCTSSFKIEKHEYDEAERKKNGREARPYTEIFHNFKGWLGPIMAKYDKADEDEDKTSTLKSIFGF